MRPVSPEWRCVEKIWITLVHPSSNADVSSFDRRSGTSLHSYFSALSFLSGTTITDRNTAMTGSPGVHLSDPSGLARYDGVENESLMVVPSGCGETVHSTNSNNPDKNISWLTHAWNASDSLSIPYVVLPDIKSTIYAYAGDSGHHHVGMFSSMQTINPPPIVVASVTGVRGNTLKKFNGLAGITKDCQNRLYMVDIFNHHVMRWAPNASVGILIAGTGIPQVDPMGLNIPTGI